MRRYLVSALILLGLVLAPACAWAQGNTTGLVVSTCNSPTFTAGNPGPFTVDAHGNLCTNGTGGGGGSVTQGTTPWVSSITAWGGGTLGAMANYGTSPGAVLVPGVNASVTASALPAGASTSALQTTGNTSLSTIITNLGSPFQAGGSIANTTFASTQSGTWTVQPGNTANTVPWLVTGSGTAGAAAAGVLTVQGTASMTKLLVTPDSVALPANQSVNVSQFGGTNTVTGTGAGGSGIPRVTVSNDSTVGLVAGTAAIGTVTGNVNTTPTDCSGTITSGGTAQNAFAATATIHGFTIANIDASAGSGEPLWISFTGTAVAAATASYPLAAPTATTFAGLSSYSSPIGFGMNTALSVIAATTGHKFSCTRW
jgi:hypothetical protein